LPPENAELDAARAALRESVGERLGPAVRELTLQLEALRDALPDAAARLRAALRVLALKGTPVATLEIELEQALSSLHAQNDAFGEKVGARRAALDEQRRSAIVACQSDTAEAEETIARLQTQLESARQRLTEASARREQLLTACDETDAQISATQRSFERAFAEFSSEYTTLKRQLTSTESR
jgi:chromosome segregation ATPase